MNLASVTLACEEDHFQAHKLVIERTSGVLPGPITMDNGFHDEIPSEYQENKWGKTLDGEYVIDGYTFRGKRAFRKVVEGLKETFVKGFKRTINGVDFRILDTRIKGVELEIEVAIVEKVNKGLAIIKLYGPSKTKEYVVTASRSKGNSPKFVVVLAEKILKPVMGEYLTEDEGISVKDKLNTKNTVTVKGEKVNLHKCPHCEKTSYSMPGLKCHITKMHHEVHQLIDAEKQDESPMETDQDNLPQDKHDDIISEEADKIVNHLINDIISLSDKECDSTMKEEETNGNVELKYINKCDDCNYEAKADRKYKALQLISTHKLSCTLNVKKKVKKTGKCVECSFILNEPALMKKHMRDVHEQRTYSTSPPLKKKKPLSEVFSENIDSIQAEFGSLNDINLDLVEDMEIGSQDDDELMERSRKNDEKILEKTKKNVETERLQIVKDKLIENKKKKTAERKIEKAKILKKKQKQQKKDDKKKGKKKQNVLIDLAANAPNNRVPNVRSIPENCKHLFGKDDVLYAVPGDGLCGPNCAAALLFHDELFGPKLRKRMNSFFVKHWHRRYQYISQCSPGHPFKRKTREEDVEFTDPKELLDFLKFSSKAEYMWSDSEDLAIISDMYQIKIKIVTTKGLKDDKPATNWIHPDESLKVFAELKNVEMVNLVLLHENDNHFNLIISKDSDLAVLGSLSNRFNVGPIVEEVVEVEAKTEGITQDNLELIDLKKELQKCKESKEYIEKVYYKCEKELRSKTEEAEKFKIEIKDLRKIIDLKKIVKDKYSEQSPMDIEDEDDPTIEAEILVGMKKKGFKRKSPQTESFPKQSYADKVTKRYNCKECEFKGSGDLHLNNHIHLIHNEKSKLEEEFNCMECDYQGYNKIQLKNHFNLKHKKQEEINTGTLKCKICAEEFKEKWDLMNHRKGNHNGAVAQCKKFVNGTCYYTAESCWWNHSDKMNSSQSDKPTCYVCNNTFESKPDMMGHRKKYHPNIIKPCFQFINGNCPFQSEFCWFIHSQIPKDKNEATKASKDPSNEEREDDRNTSSVFRKDIKHTKPPSMQEERNKEQQQH